MADLNLQVLHGQISEAIKSLDFGKIWDGFTPVKFALYNDKECFFDGEYIEKTVDFCANTAIEYKGEYIAIWYTVNEMSIPDFASRVVHEMFHAFQHNQKLIYCQPKL